MGHVFNIMIIEGFEESCKGDWAIFLINILRWLAE